MKVRVTGPLAVAGAAEMATFCAVPGVNVSVDGWAVTPVGRPVIATDTMPVKLLAAVALMLICCGGPPGTSVMLPGVEASEKSAGGFGEELLQEMSKRQVMKLEQARNNLGEEAIWNSPGPQGFFGSGFSYSRCCRTTIECGLS